MKRILFFLFLSVFSCTLIAQTGPSKKCPTCGLSMAHCKYKGRHPKCSTCGKELLQCKYSGHHPKPKCSICGKLLTDCQYGGDHPKCSTCGKLLTDCQYGGHHPKPKCSACGKLLTDCQYNGNHPKPTKGTINGYEWVDLGLSVKWATCNVGASSPSDYGNYYAWGETTTKSEYTEENCKTWKKDVGDISGSPQYDEARANWGGSWRLPSKKECEELESKCTWIWTSQGGHNGYKVTGPNDNSIFLPAVGWRYGASLGDAGDNGYYWSSTPYESNTQDAYGLYFGSGDHYVIWCSRFNGFSVRPVSE